MRQTTGDPRSVSLNASYHKEQQYIYGLEWEGDMKVFWDIKPYVN